MFLVSFAFPAARRMEAPTSGRDAVLLAPVAWHSGKVVSNGRNGVGFCHVL